MFNLKRERDFLSIVSACRWVDDDPEECCDIIEVFSKAVR